MGIRNFSITDRKDFLKISGLATGKKNYKNFAKIAIIEKGLKKMIRNLSLELAEV